MSEEALLKNLDRKVTDLSKNLDAISKQLDAMERIVGNVGGLMTGLQKAIENKIRGVGQDIQAEIISMQQMVATLS
jgi:hypothetical protein